MPLPRVELYRTQERANAMAKRAAAEAGPRASLGVRRMTPAGLVEELWELWGDRRALVSGVRRNLLVGSLLADQNLFVASQGASALLGSFFSCNASKIENEDAPAFLTAYEQAVLELACRYLQLLDKHGLVEADSAAAALACAVEEGAVPPCAIEVVDPLRLSPGLQRLIDALSSAGALSAREDGLVDGLSARVGPLPDGVSPEFLVPAGPGAVASLVRESIARAIAKGSESVLVCGDNATALAEALCAELASKKVNCALRLQMPAQQTDVARLWRAVGKVADGSCSAADATDVAANPLLGLAPWQVQAFNTELRENRLLSPEEIAERLRALSPLFAQVEKAQQALASGQASFLSEAAKALEDACLSVASNSALACKREQAAAKALFNLADQADLLGVAPGTLIDLWLSGNLRVEALCNGAETPVVEFATSNRLQSLSPASYDAVILSDFSTESFRARAGSSSLDELAEKLGWAQELSVFDEQRRLFIDAQTAARTTFACVILQRTADGDPAYPSFLLKEYLEALARAGYEAALERGESEEADAWLVGFPDLFDIPEALSAVTFQSGEDALIKSVGANFQEPETTVSLEAVERGKLNRLRLTDYLRRVTEAGEELLVLSPSAIELYLGCPYAWFIQRKINPAPLGEQFGPLEKGSFVHAVLAAFYEELAARGRVRVEPAHSAEDAALLDEVFNAQVRKEAQRNPAGGRLVATSSAERLQIERLRFAIHESLRRQARFAPSFAVREHEHKIGVEDGVDYAGVRLNGSVDRIDVNEPAGQFYVIDYKGSTKSNYSLLKWLENTDEPNLPIHPQAYIYAQALRSQLEGLHCVGVLYLSYKAKIDKEMVAGAVQQNALDDAGFIKSTSLSPLNFDVLLDRIEQQVSEGLAGLYVSDISERPRYKDICTYCPVPDCERRQK